MYIVCMFNIGTQFPYLNNEITKLLLNYNFFGYFMTYEKTN